MNNEERDAKRTEAVKAAYDCIHNDYAFTAPEMVGVLKEKVMLRLENMAFFLLPDLDPEEEDRDSYPPEESAERAQGIDDGEDRYSEGYSDGHEDGMELV